MNSQPTMLTSSRAVFAEDPDFRKSFLKTRVIVGVIGVLMPFALVLGNQLVYGQHGFRPSLSDYYHTGMRNWFVGSLWAIGTGLLVYLAARRNRTDSTISFIAGLLAIGVAELPTNGPGAPETTVSTLHLVCAGTLFFLLGVICYRFGQRDGVRPDRTRRWQQIWGRVHKTCAVIIWVAIVASVAAGFVAEAVVLLGESVAVLSFGVSWFAKGSEIFNQLREERDKPPLLRSPGVSS